MARKKTAGHDGEDWPVQEAQDEDGFEESPGVAGSPRRIVDWKQLLLLPVQLAFLGVIVVMIVGYGMKLPTFAVILAILFVAAVPVAFVVNAKGVLLDPAADALSYPVYVFRRRIPLSAIRAANCENVTHRSDTSMYARLVGEKGGRAQTSKTYHVNLSGDFESRRLVFTSKYKRDQFLAYLRDFVPRCRITRWS